MGGFPVATGWPCPALSNQELEAVNCKIAKAAVSGRLNKSPFVQGILARLVSKLDKEERGVSTTRGRSKSMTETESMLVSDTALSLSVLCANKNLCMELGQKVRGPRINMEDLPQHGIPNPCLSLLSDSVSQLDENFTLLDQAYSRSETTPARRMILAIDATYLCKSMTQHCKRGEVGLVGGCWAPSEESEAFIPLTHGKLGTHTKAPLMMECLAWNPNSFTTQAYSVASMPMGLAARQAEGETKTHKGNWEPRF